MADNVFIQSIGDDFACALVAGLLDRFGNAEQLARVTLLVNTRRAARRIATLLQDETPRFLPRILTVAQIADDPLYLAQLPQKYTPLARKLALAQMLNHWRARDPKMLAEHTVFDIADSLLALLDELHGQDVAVERLMQLDLGDHAAHWQNAHRFLQIAVQFDEQFKLQSESARFCAVLDVYGAYWEKYPSNDPIIVAGSTGSRAHTRRLMQLILQQPKGMVILPGFDPHLKQSTWMDLPKKSQFLSHPQAQLAASFDVLAVVDPSVLPAWYKTKTPINKQRGELVSISLAPAPLTQDWLLQAPKLEEMVQAATQGFDLLIAQTQREEAQAIACRIRAAVQEQKSVALITPDRNLARYVSAALKRWGIRGDESVGIPLGLTPLGILARMVLEIAEQPYDSVQWIALLKHGLVNQADRGAHMLLVQRLEYELRRDILQKWTPEVILKDMDAAPWLVWLFDLREKIAALYTQADRSAAHRIVMDNLLAGPMGQAPDANRDVDQKLAEVFDMLAQNADAIAVLPRVQYKALFHNLLHDEVPQPAFDHHPLVSIWGTLEARSQSTEIAILGGLNETVWPGSPKSDAWLSRALRLDLGLLSPDRSTSLAAHDYQLGMSTAQQVCISLSQHIGTAVVNPSRWVTRLMQLLNGMGDNGKAALSGMQKRGDIWLNHARVLEQPKDKQPRAPRPAPRPVQAGLLRKLSATQIKKLILSPYDIYVDRILNLRLLEPLRRHADYRLRGTALHGALEAVNKAWQSGTCVDLARFSAICDQALADYTDQSAVHAQWVAHLEHIAPWLLANQQERMKADRILGIEMRGELPLLEFGITLSAKADRIDQSPDGLKIYDYKSGRLPQAHKPESIDKQMPIAALIAQGGGFGSLSDMQLCALRYISLGQEQKEIDLPVDDHFINGVWEGLQNLLGLYVDPNMGFIARDKMKNAKEPLDYDHLSRFGEWSQSDAPCVINVGGKPDG